MKPVTLATFWRSFVLTSAIALVTLPLLTQAVIDYGTRTVSIEAHRSVSALGQPQIEIVANNSSQIPLNAVEFELAFDPNVMQISDADFASPLCEERFVITNLVDNQRGQVFLQCGTITPVTATATTIAVLNLQDLRAVPTAHFTDRTNVHAHDGYGTNVTGSTTVLF